MQPLNQRVNDVSIYIEKAILKGEVPDSIANYVNRILNKECLTIENIPHLEPEKRAAVFAKIRNKIEKFHSQSMGIECSKLTWCTGTRSNIFFGLEQVRQLNLEDGHMALVPTGRLIDHNIVPLCGELKNGIGVKGINQMCVSGVSVSDFKLAFNYAYNNNYSQPSLRESKEYIMEFAKSDPSMKIVYSHTFKLHVLRYLKLRESNDPDFETIRNAIKKDFDIETPISDEWMLAIQKGMIECEDSTFGTENFPADRPFCNQDTQLVPGSVIGYYTRAFDSWNWAVVSSVENNHVTFLSDPHSFLTREKTKLKRPIPEDFLNTDAFALRESMAFRRIEAKLGFYACATMRNLYENYATIHPLTDEEKNRLRDQNYPLIFGAPINKDLLRGSGWETEQVYTGSLRLEKDVTLIFAKKRNLQDVNQWLERNQIQMKTTTFSSLFFLSLLEDFNRSGV